MYLCAGGTASRLHIPPPAEMPEHVGGTSILLAIMNSNPSLDYWSLLEMHHYAFA